MIRSRLPRLAGLLLVLAGVLLGATGPDRGRSCNAVEVT